MTYTIDDILDIAAGLVSEDGENPEYDRAIAEMTCDLLNLPIGDNIASVRALINTRREV